MDTAFLVKADLETNMEALVQEISFLKDLYEEVPSTCLCAPGSGGVVQGGSGQGSIRLAQAGAES